MNNTFYVYVYLDPRYPGNYTYGKYSFSFKPIYIGKGTGNRCYVHLTTSCLSHDSNILKSRLLSKLINEGYNLHEYIVIIKNNMLEEAAYKLERSLILKIGRRISKTGPLVNICEDGRGGPRMYGKNNPNTRPEVNKKKSDSLKLAYKEGRMVPQIHFFSKETMKARNKKISKAKFKYWNKENRQNMCTNNPNGKSWLLISPDNTEYKIHSNLSAFCKLHKLYAPIMRKIGNKIYSKPTYNGWRCVKL